MDQTRPPDLCSLYRGNNKSENEEAREEGLWKRVCNLLYGFMEEMGFLALLVIALTLEMSIPAEKERVYFRVVEMIIAASFAAVLYFLYSRVLKGARVPGEEPQTETTAVASPGKACACAKNMKNCLKNKEVVMSFKHFAAGKTGRSNAFLQINNRSGHDVYLEINAKPLPPKRLQQMKISFEAFGAGVEVDTAFVNPPVPKPAFVAAFMIKAGDVVDVQLRGVEHVWVCAKVSSSSKDTLAVVSAAGGDSLWLLA